jgi:hypothetical protein
VFICGYTELLQLGFAELPFASLPSLSNLIRWPRHSMRFPVKAHSQTAVWKTSFIGASQP